MEKQSSSRRQTHSPRLLRAQSTTTTPDISRFTPSPGRKSVERSNYATRSRIGNSSRGGEENTNNTSSTIINKKPQENLIGNSPVLNLQRHRSPDVFKTIEKVKTNRKDSVSPSAWALSPGRSSPIFPVQESPDYSGRTKSERTKPRSRSVGNVLNYFKQKESSLIQEEAFHQLRIMHTRFLQWRFVNAQAESTLAARKYFAEEKIFQVWLRIFHLRNSIVEKQLQIQQLKNEIKIIRIINPQVCILNKWEKIEKKNSEAIARIDRKLSASTTALPLINNAKGDTNSVQNAMLTAMGIMDSIEATITKLISKVQETGLLAFELVNTVEQERKGLEELRKGITIVASLESQEKSLRAHIIQTEKESRSQFIGKDRYLGGKGRYLGLYLSSVK